MHPGERKVWLEMPPEEYDPRMEAIGQAKANAFLVKQMFEEHPLAEGSRLLVHGCGTCQMFDYIPPSDLGEEVDLTLADFNSSSLDAAEERMRKFPGTNYQTSVDDIEHTSLAGKRDAVLIVLVLQHVEWKSALRSMSTLDPSRFYLIIQEQPQAQPVMTTTNTAYLTPAWQQYADIGAPKLVPKAELTGYMKKQGFEEIADYRREVPDNKAMVGLVLEKT